MDEHPSVSIDCAGLRNGLPTLEESASLVLWGWPELLGWPRTIRWLFSPVVGKSPYPGDLWGIDERGELVIVETKLYRAGRAPDPFSDFLECSDHDYVRCHWEPAPLEKRWRDLLRAERQFCSKHATAFWSSPEPTEGLFRGVLPYSRHRKAAWQWPTLCKERLMPLFAAHDYEQAIESSLKARADGNTAVAFVGVVATTLPRDPRLSAQGCRAMAALKEGQRSATVVLRALRVSPSAPGRVRVDCWSTAG